jgi:Xaa-Pro aminopeptidase
MRDHDVQYALITSPENVFYTTGYTTLPSSHNPILYSLRNQFPWAVWLNNDGRVSLVCWGYSTYQVQFGVDEVLGFNSRTEAVNLMRTLLAGAAAEKARVAVESDCPWWMLALYQEQGGDWNRLKPFDDVLLRLRLIKSPAEIERLERAVGIAEQTLEELYGILHIGMSRLDLIREAKYRAIRRGATGISHITMSFGRENPEIGIPEVLEPGCLVTLDVGAVYDGYFSDNRRYAFAGSIPEVLQRRYVDMVSIVDAVGAAMKPGVTYESLNRLAVDLHREHGLQPMFNHVGHHMGLATEEQWIASDVAGVIQPGMVINLEMYVPVFEVGSAIGTEESYVIEEDGPRQISQMARSIRRI